MPNSKSFLISLMVLILSACSIPEPKDRASQTGHGKDQSADFYIDSIRGSVIDTKFEESFSLPSARVYNFTACVKSLSHARPLTNQEFEIKESKKMIRSDSSGCLNWSEEISFNYLDQSTYLSLKRTIKSKGLARGSRVAEVGVNPWSHGLSAPLPPVDLKKNEVAQISSDRIPKERPLWMEDLRLSVTDDRIMADGLHMTYQLYGTPRLVLNSMENERVLEILKRGKFSLRLKLLQQDLVEGKEIRLELAQHSLSEINIQNETLAVRVPLVLPQVPKSGQLFLALEMNPIGEKSGQMKGFQGLYSMGDFKNLRAPNFLKISPLVVENPNFKIENFVTPRTTSPAGNLTTPHQQRAAIEVDRLQFNFIQRGAESALKKSLIYRVRACIRSGVDQELVQSRSFQVTKARFSGSPATAPVTLKTDHTSCLNWEEKVDFDYYSCQHFMKAEVLIENSDLGVKERLTYAINPWEAGAGFALDLRDVDQTKNMTFTCDPRTQVKTQLDLESYSYSKKSLTYDVDRDLNLIIKKKVLFRMNPRALLYSNLNNGLMENQPLRDGPYVLRLAVVRNKDYDSRNTYVTHTEKLVRVLGGRISEEITLVSRDLKALGNRNTLFIDLRPIDPNKVTVDRDGSFHLGRRVGSINSALATKSDLVSIPFHGTIVLGENDGGSDLERTDSSMLSRFVLQKAPQSSQESDVLTQLIRQGWTKQREELAQSAKNGETKTYSEQEGLQILRLKNLDKAQLQSLSVRSTDMSDYGIRRFESQKIWNSARQAAKPIDLEQISPLIQGQWTDSAIESLCLYFTHELIAPSIERGAASQFRLNCLEMAKNQIADVFQLEKRLLTHHVQSAQFIRGSRHSLKVGTSFSLTNSHAETFGTNRSLTTSLGLGSRFFNWISLGVSGSVSMNWGTQDSESTAHGISVAQDVGLNVAENIMRLKITQSESCAIIRLKPELFQKQSSSWFNLFGQQDWTDLLDPDVSSAKHLETISRGIMICSGELNRQPLEVMESFYLINQEAKDNDLLDSEDERNRPFFLALRGKSDYDRFVAMIQKAPKIPPSAEAGTNEFGTLEGLLNSALTTTRTIPRQISLP